MYVYIYIYTHNYRYYIYIYIYTYIYIYIYREREREREIQAYATADRVKWCLEWPGQVVLATDCIYWTDEMTTALKGNTLDQYEKKLFSQLGDIVTLIRSGQMTKLGRTTVGAMVTIDVHARDETTELVKKGVNDPASFSWLKQLRYYWQDINTANT